MESGEGLRFLEDARSRQGINSGVRQFDPAGKNGVPKGTPHSFVLLYSPKKSQK